MLQSNLSLPVRSANLEDADALCALLNEVIIIGGTTAIETPLKTEEFRDYFL